MITKNITHAFLLKYNLRLYTTCIKNEVILVDFSLANTFA